MSNDEQNAQDARKMVAQRAFALAWVCGIAACIFDGVIQDMLVLSCAFAIILAIIAGIIWMGNDY